MEQPVKVTYVVFAIALDVLSTAQNSLIHLPKIHLPCLTGHSKLLFHIQICTFNNSELFPFFALSLKDMSVCEMIGFIGMFVGIYN